MNVFATDKNPAIAVKHLDDRRLVKMILETAQIICTVCHENPLYGASHIPYKPTHKNHPVVRWAAQGGTNLAWLACYFVELNNEWKRRFGHARNHLSFDKCIELSVVQGALHRKRNKKFDNVQFANCAVNSEKGINFKHIKNPTQAYRKYLAARWDYEILNDGYTHRFTNTSYPTFFPE